MTKPDQAVADFRAGFSCSQVVLAAYAAELGMDRDLALKLSTTFGGGMGRLGQTCGAVTGALMILGLKYGRTRADDNETKDRAYALVVEFAEAFRQRHGSLNCTGLLGHDLGNLEERQLVHDQGLSEKLCTRFVHDAVELVEEMIGKSGA